MALSLKSRSFGNHQYIPARFAAEESNISPALEWSGVPNGTQEFALICEDPDTPMAHPFVHWILYGISPSTSQIPEGLPTRSEVEYPILARQGLNSLSSTGYTGPNPPRSHGPHRYIFRLFALNAPITLPPRAGKDELMKEIRAHLIEEAELIGLYEKQSVFKRKNLFPIATGLLTALSTYSAWSQKRRARG